MSGIAYEAERELNTHQKKQGTDPQSVSATESGVNARVERDFPGAEVRYGPGSVPRNSDRMKITPEEGGDYDVLGRVTEAKQFEGRGGPEDKMRIKQERRPGDEGVPVQAVNYNARR
ncbi:hypothetical protein VTN31DRAFT_3339 [Thermomyces dupontii]|uniref:uncharacterized protein n=1 Tax=Talaromyces thermophilus TaxID=28565 RepID=UPI0037431BEB